MIRWLVSMFIVWATRDTVPTFQIVNRGSGVAKEGFVRYMFFRPDEWEDKWWRNEDGSLKTTKRPNALPWWLPLNMFLHHWCPEPGYEEGMHDHPRWTITVCLRGQILERTPWGERLLRPGSVVIRSRKAIHGFYVPEKYVGKTYTLFIVGRRKYRQNYYVVTPI